MDLFFFISEQTDSGMLSLDGDMGEMLSGLSKQLGSAKAQMQGEHYSRMVVALNLPEESQETFDFLDTIHMEAEKFYPADQIFLVGNSTSDSDLADAFERDNIIISVLSILFVILVLLFTFKSVGLPVLLILIIQGSIWMNFTYPALTDTPIFFMSYLIIVAIQMGSNIDYAIVISSRYQEMRQEFPPKEAIVKALTLAFPTVLTSGSILVSASFLLGIISTEPSIVGMGECLCRGTIISIVLIMFILPQLLVLGDKIVEKTRFNIKHPEISRSAQGTIFVNGRVRGQINGMVDATMRGVIRGDVTAMVDVDTLKSAEEEAPEDEVN
jgi:predicted RND superfamily exporter protein